MGGIIGGRVDDGVLRLRLVAGVGCACAAMGNVDDGLLRRHGHGRPELEQLDGCWKAEAQRKGG